MEFFERALQLLPQAASSPLAFVAYVITIAGWLWAWSNTLQMRTLLEGLKNLPDAQKPSYVRSVTDKIVPSSITVEEWVRARRDKYLFSIIILAFFLVLCITGLAMWRAKS